MTKKLVTDKCQIVLHHKYSTALPTCDKISEYRTKKKYWWIDQKSPEYINLKFKTLQKKIALRRNLRRDNRR